MSDFWSKINDVQFEDIAQHFAQSVLPEWEWKPTKRSWDKSKDGKALIYDKKTNFGIHLTQEAWYEAKYSKNSHHAISLAKIAATVLIGYNNRDRVGLILIITNASFSTDTVNEIETALGKKVKFVYGKDLKEWLLQKEQIYLRRKYKLSNKDASEEKEDYFIGTPLIIKPNCIHNTISTSNESLKIGEKYELCFQLNVPFYLDHEFNFEIERVWDSIQIESGYKLIIEKGNNLLRIPFVPVKETVRKCYSLITIKETITGICFEIFKTLHIDQKKDFELPNQSHAECSYILKNAFETFRGSCEMSVIHLLQGHAGHGKSTVLEKFISDLDQHEYLFVKFRKGKELINNLLALRVLIFIVFGRLFSDNKMEEEDIIQIEKFTEYNSLFTDYLRFLTDENNILENVNKLLNRHELIPLTSSIHEKILILDDLQFLDPKAAQLIYKILDELTSSNHKLFIIASLRKGDMSYPELEEFMKTYSTRTPLEICISEDDVLESLQCHKIPTAPKQIIKKLTKEYLRLTKFISVASRCENTQIIDILKNKEITDIINTVNINKINYINMTAEEKCLTDIVYFFEKGVEHEYTYENYPETVISNLLDTKIIKYDYSKKGFIPYHDIIWESFARIINPRSKHIYHYADYQKNKGNSMEYLGILNYFPTELIRNKDFLITEVAKFHEKQMYYNNYYILSRLFSKDKNKTDVGSKYDNALLLFYYAYSTFNVGDNNGSDIFQKAYSLLKGKLCDNEKSLSNLILSEIANCDYWNLNLTSVREKYDTISKDFFERKERSKDDWKAFMTICNRNALSKLLMDEKISLENVLKDVKPLIENEELEKMSVGLKVLYYTFNFNNDPIESYKEFKELVEKQGDLSVKTEFSIKTRFYKMECMLGKSETNQLEDMIEWGKENNLNYNYRIATLHLATCHATRKDFIKLEEALNNVVDLRDFPLFPMGIYYNLRALVYFTKKEYKLAEDDLIRQKECFKNLGNSFLKKIENNISTVRRHCREFDIDYCYPASSGNPIFYIEAAL